MKSRQQPRATVTDGLNAGEGIPALILNTCVGLLSGARGGVLLTQKEVIGFPSQVLAVLARKSPHPLQISHDALNNIADWFHRSSPIHGRAPAFCRGQLATGVRAMSCWAMVPQPVHPSHFLKTDYIAHLICLLKFVLSRKQTNNGGDLWLSDKSLVKIQQNQMRLA